MVDARFGGIEHIEIDVKICTFVCAWILAHSGSSAAFKRVSGCVAHPLSERGTVEQRTLIDIQSRAPSKTVVPRALGESRGRWLPNLPQHLPPSGVPCLSKR